MDIRFTELQLIAGMDTRFRDALLVPPTILNIFGVCQIHRYVTP
jgi:hypothetical protein